MLNILLIDDEYLVLKGVESMLNNQQLFPVRVTAFLDAVDAMEQLPSLRPDAVVLDINMPELNGLDFIEKAIARGYSGSFIIISGYEEITYLKRAFELHVADYIKKPIDKQKLLSSLQRIHNSRLQKDQTLLMHLQQRLRLAGMEGGAQFSRHDWEHLLPQEYLCLISVRRAYEAEQAQKIAQRLEQYFQPVHYLHFHVSDMFLCALPQPLQREELSAIAHACGVSAEDVTGFSPVYDRGRLIDLLIRGEHCPLLMEATADAIIHEIRLEALIPRTELLSLSHIAALVRSCADPEVSDAFRRRFSQGPVQAAYALCFVEAMAAFLVRHGYQPAPGHLATLYHLMLEESGDAFALWKRLKDVPQQYFRLAPSPRPEAEMYSEKIEMAIHYIYTHYPEDISLHDVAQSVGLSASYFSSAFRREVGVSFVNFLKSLRMEKACTLLLTHPHMSVETVAAKVGYQTIGQFYKVFKSEYSVSPKAWKDKNLAPGQGEEETE